MRSDLTDITEHLELEAIAVVDRGVVTRGQRLVVRNLLLEAKDEIESLRDALEGQRQPNPFDEHTRMWEDEIRGMGLNPDHVRKIAAEAKPYVDIPFGDVRGLPAFDPEVLDEVRRLYENNGREKQ